MTRITNADQVLLLLRSHLQRSERARRSSKTEKTAGSRKAKQTPLDRVQDIAQNTALSDEEIKRALISGIFTEEFGATAANDPKFQAMIDDVFRMVREHSTGRELLSRAMAQLAEKRS